MTLHYSSHAHEDRRRIWIDGVQRFGESDADAYLMNIDETLRATLGTFPNSGRARPEFGADIRSVPIVPFVAFYRVIGKRIEVLRILHGQRDLSGSLLSLLVAI